MIGDEASKRLFWLCYSFVSLSPPLNNTGAVQVTDRLRGLTMTQNYRGLRTGKFILREVNASVGKHAIEQSNRNY